MLFRFAFAILSIAASGEALGCRTIAPNLDDTSEYASVFFGRVTGIHLVDYEESLLASGADGRSGLSDAELLDAPIRATNGASTVVVFVVPTTVVVGHPGKRMSVELVGCTTRLPSLRELGAFFVHSDRTSAITVWESQEPEFAAVVTSVGARRDAL